MNATQCVTPDGYPYTTSYPTCPEPIVTVPVSVKELPHTGATLDAALLGVALVVAGTALRFIRR